MQLYAHVRLTTNLNQHFICTQEGFDTDVADVMITWIRESIATHVDASRVCVVDNSIKGLLATLVDFVTKRHGGATCHSDAMEGVRKTVRASMLCLDVTRACIDRAETVMSEFVLQVSPTARRQLLLGVTKLTHMG